MRRVMMKPANPWNVGPSNSKRLRLIGRLALRVRTCHSDTTCTGTESYSNWHVSHENLLNNHKGKWLLLRHCQRVKQNLRTKAFSSFESSETTKHHRIMHLIFYSGFLLWSVLEFEAPTLLPRQLVSIRWLKISFPALCHWIQCHATAHWASHSIMSAVCISLDNYTDGEKNHETEICAKSLFPATFFCDLCH